MMKKGLRIVILSLIAGFHLIGDMQSQQKDYYQAPLDIPLYLSGSFGELRGSHFHAGIDFKTQAEIGKNIYAAADGYISRIKIQTGGYGRALYINHPNGETTVYAHLHEYAPEIEKYVKAYQYRNKTHTLDLYLSSEKLKVQKGELIGISGNSGSSGGPHLHFEIRKSGNQAPVNALKYGFDVTDNIPPTIKGLAIYPLKNGLVNGQKSKLILNPVGGNGTYSISESPVRVSGNIGFGLEAYDYMDGSHNRCGLYSLEMKIDGKRLYYHVVDEFSFIEAGYIKSHVDYEEKVKSGREFQKTFKDPNNKLGFYRQTLPTEGMPFTDEQTHTVELIAKDTYGNSSILKFDVQAAPVMGNVNTILDNHEKGINFSYARDNHFEDNEIKITVPKYALFTDIPFFYESYKSAALNFSSLHQVHNIYTPLYRNMTLQIKADVPEELVEKVILVNVDKDNDHHIFNATYEAGWVTARVKQFGPWFVDVDTLAPEIKPVNIYNGANMQNRHDIRFIVTDRHTGISSYNGYINGEWVLFEYDPKNNLIMYQFDDTRLSHGEHQLELIITDGKGNESRYNANFRY